MAIRVTVYGTADMRQIEKAQQTLNRLSQQAKIAAGGIQGQMLLMGASLSKAGAAMTRTGQQLTRNLTVPLVAAGYAIARMTEAAAEDQKAQVVLATTLRNTAGATDETIAATERFITAQQKLLGVTDDQLRPALGILAGATKDVAKAQELSTLALDISAARGVDAETAAKALAKAYTGNLGSLSRLVPGIDQAAIQSGKFSKVQKALADMVGGTASKAAETQAGKMQIAKVAFQEATETLGYAFLPIMESVTTLITTHVIPAVERMAAWFGKLSPQVKNTILIVAGIAAALGPVIVVMGAVTSGAGSLLTALGKMPGAWLRFLGPVGLVVGVVAALLASSPALREMLGNFLQSTLKALAPLWDTIVKAMQPVVAALQKLINAVLPILVELFSAILPPAIALITNALNFLVPAFQLVINVVSTIITTLTNLATAFVNTGKNIVDGLLKGIKKAWEGLTQWIGNAVDNVIDTVKDFLGIASPSKVFAEIGMNMGRGLQIGLERTTGRVALAARSVAAAASVTAMISAGAGSATAASNLTTSAMSTASAGAAVNISPGAVQIVINGNTDPSKVGGAVEDALGRLLREVRSR